MFVLTMLVLTAVAVLALAIGRGERPGRHQRSPMGPVRGDGSGLTEEGVASMDTEPEDSEPEGTEPAALFRGPEDDPDFLAQLNRLERPEPPAEA